MASWKGYLIACLSVAFVACAPRHAEPSHAAPARSIGDETAVVSKHDASTATQPRRANPVERARQRDTIVIHTAQAQQFRSHPAMGTLLQIDPPGASLPGVW